MPITRVAPGELMPEIDENDVESADTYPNRMSSMIMLIIGAFVFGALTILDLCGFILGDGHYHFIDFIIGAIALFYAGSAIFVYRLR
ncbi:MAG: hypothetical protein ABIS59_01940 [Candidatus Saccharibacteria bacterium]